jgi:WD40 repeat protein
LGEARSYVGTEGFIPPEGPGRPQADVYSLGKVLYEACTGKDRLDFPDLPSELEDLPDKKRFWELNEVILAACKTDLKARYGSAFDMHADLLLLANGKSVKRLRQLERVWGLAKRTALMLSIVLALIGTASFVFWREHKHRLERQQQKIGEDLAYGNQALNTGDLLGSLPYFVDALKSQDRGGEPAKMLRLRIGAIFAQAPKLTHIWAEPKEVRSCEFSSDGKQVLVARYYGEARVYDLQTEQLITSGLASTTRLAQAVFSPDGDCIATAGEARTADVWKSKTANHVASLRHPGQVLSVCFSPDGALLASGCTDGHLRIWKWASGELIRELEGHKAAIRFVRYSPDRKYILTGSMDRTARIWSADGGTNSLAILKHGQAVLSAAFSPDGERLLTASTDHRARLWSVSSGAKILELPHRDVVTAVDFSPDGRFILTASLDGLVKIWSAVTLQPAMVNSLLRHPDRVMAAKFSPDGRQIISACVDGSVRVWDFAHSWCNPPVRRLTFSKDGRRFLSNDVSGLRLWNTKSNQITSALMTPIGVLIHSQFSEDGRHVLSMSETVDGAKMMQVWNESGISVSEPILATSPAAGAALSYSAQYVASWTSNVISVIKLPSRQVVTAFHVTNGVITRCVISEARGQVYFSAGSLVFALNLGENDLRFPPLPHICPVSNLALSPDSKRLVTCCNDGTLTKCYAQIWDVETGKAFGPRLLHDDGVLAVQFSPDGSRIGTAGEDEKAYIWDVNTGQRCTPALEHLSQIQRISFSANSKLIVTASSDRTARIWDAQSGAPLTPPLSHPHSLSDAFFDGESSRVICVDSYTNTFVWSLPQETRTVAQLEMLSGLLNGTPVKDGTISSGSPIPLFWMKLRESNPAECVTSRSEAIAWHFAQAARCEADSNLDALHFHLNWILRYSPNDESAIARLATKIKKEHQ